MANGLNQQTSIGGTGATWDSKGNLTSEPQSGRAYSYSSENLLKTASGGVTLAYDPLLRLYDVTGAATTRFAYDGFDAIAEYSVANALQRRFVFDPAGVTGQPILWYEGAVTTNRRFLSADERRSVISLTDSAGALIAINAYDEFGKPGAANQGRFQYTGQKWLSEAGVYDYHFRAYLPHLGIFAQTDPIGQADSPNLYPYVLNDPVNLADPLGLFCDIYTTVCGRRLPDDGGTNRGRAGRSWLPGPGVGRGDGPNGGGDGGPIGPATPPAPQKTQTMCRPSANDLKNSGKVTFKFSELNVSALGTSGDAFGTFRTSRGYYGTFHTSFDGIFIGGKGVGVYYGGGSSRTLATFSGVNYNIVGTLGPYSISDNFDPSSGQHVGQTDAASTLGLGIGGTRSDTTLVTISCPR